MKKRLLLIVALVLIIIIGGIVFFLVPTHSEPVVSETASTTHPSMVTADNTASDDSDLRSYEDSQLGFSMQIPKVGPEGEPVKVVSIDTGQGISVQYTRSSDGYVWKWDIYLETVVNEKELADFIDAHYTNTKLIATGVCKIESLEPTEYKDTFNVILSGQGAYDGDTSCGNGSRTYIKYSPSLEKAAMWNAGQDIGFYQIVDGVEKSYEDEMAASFHFQ